MQINLFTAAVEHKQKALDYLQHFSLAQARAELEAAQNIDPYLADIKTLQQAVDTLLEQGINADSEVSTLAGVWEALRGRGPSLTRTVRTIVERLICQQIVRLVAAEYCDFVVPEKETLHIGYCCLVLERPQDAHRVLLEYLTAHPESLHARLWGYFGDAATLLQYDEEANTGYLHALFVDVQAVDMEFLQSPELRRVYKMLRREHDDLVSRALLPIHAWLERVLTIPKGKTVLSQRFQGQRQQYGSELPVDAVQRYQRFARCLYLDQSCMPGKIDVEARLEMKRLDGVLFQRYLRRLQ
ncbi:MAG: hypothetical protein ACE5IY_06210 [bacterium]